MPDLMWSFMNILIQPIFPLLNINTASLILHFKVFILSNTFLGTQVQMKLNDSLGFWVHPCIHLADNMCQVSVDGLDDFHYSFRNLRLCSKLSRALCEVWPCFKSRWKMWMLWLTVIWEFMEICSPECFSRTVKIVCIISNYHAIKLLKFINCFIS